MLPAFGSPLALAEMERGSQEGKRRESRSPRCLLLLLSSVSVISHSERALFVCSEHGPNTVGQKRCEIAGERGEGSASNECLMRGKWSSFQQMSASFRDQEQQSTVKQNGALQVMSKNSRKKENTMTHFGSCSIQQLIK